MEMVVPWDRGTLGKLVSDFWKTDMEPLPDGEEKPLGGEDCLRLAINILMLLSWVPDEVGEEKCVRKAQADRQGGILKTELWEPKFIGRPTFEQRKPSDRGEVDGTYRFNQVRRAHWKRQAHGPAYSLRKVIWVSLYRTRSREDRGLPPES